MQPNDLHKLYQWEDTNNMKFNARNFELLRYGREHAANKIFNDLQIIR